MNILNKSKQKLFFRVIALLITFQLIFAESVLSQRFGLSTSTLPIPTLTKAPIGFLSINIPEHLGQIKSMHVGTDSKRIIHIQDSHVNYEAQQNIIQILKILSKEQQDFLIAIEGAQGESNLQWFREYPEKEMTKKVLDLFLRKGHLSSAQFFQVFSPFPVKVFGVEDRQLYQKNLTYFQKTYAHNKEILSYVKEIERGMKEVAKALYPDSLYRLSEESLLFHENKMSPKDYLPILRNHIEINNIDLNPFPQIKLSLEAIQQESNINYKYVNKHRRLFLKKLQKRLTREESTELTKQSIRFRLGKISQLKFYNYLEELASEKHVDLNDTPQFKRYIAIVRLHVQINSDQLLNEIQALEVILKDLLFENEDQRECDRLFGCLRILKNLSRLEMTRKQLDEYLKYPGNYIAEEFLFFIEDQSQKLKIKIKVKPEVDQINGYFKFMEGFYETALERDRVLAQNTIKAMEETGGFNSCFNHRWFSYRWIDRIL